MTPAFDSLEPPRTALLMDPDEVPADLRGELGALVTTVWQPSAAVTAIDRRAEILVTANADLNGGVLSVMAALKLIVTTGTAYDYVDLVHCRAHGIAVCNTPGYAGSSVAEHAVALYFAVNRRIPMLDAAVREGVPDTSAHVAQEAEGKTAGVVGLGDIGSRIARIALGYGMRVRFANSSERTLPGAEQVDMATLLRTADVVFLCIPLTGRSRHLLSTDEFKAMKNTAFVINISSDELIDPQALGGALRDGLIAGAGLDVIGSAEFYVGLPNIVLTPAHGWYTAEGVRRRALTWVAAVRGAVQGRLVNRVV